MHITVYPTNMLTIIKLAFNGRVWEVTVFASDPSPFESISSPYNMSISLEILQKLNTMKKIFLIKMNVFSD